MKALLTFLMFTVLAAPLSVAQAETPQSKEVAIGISNVYIPGGFGPDTDAFVIASGMYPNSCYRWERTEVKSVEPMVQEIRTYAAVSQSICLMVLVPYSQEIRLGRLASGVHTLRFLAGDGTYFERSMTVE